MSPCEVSVRSCDVQIRVVGVVGRLEERRYWASPFPLWGSVKSYKSFIQQPQYQLYLCSKHRNSVSEKFWPALSTLYMNGGKHSKSNKCTLFSQKGVEANPPFGQLQLR